MFDANLMMTDDGEREYVIAPIKRDKEGKIVKIGKPELRKFVGNGGWEFSAEDISPVWKEAAAAYEEWKKKH